jgi:hypothetical protein
MELSPSTTCRARQVEHEIPDSPPPPYCAIPETFDPTHTASMYASTTTTSALLAVESNSGILRDRPVSAQKPHCRIIQFRRFIVEAIALNLRADFRALNAILYPDANNRCSNSILTPVERADLLDLARLVQRMHGEVKRGQILNPQDKDRISKAILEPYCEITWCHNPHFVFDLISRLSPEGSTGYTSQKELEWLKNTKDLIQRVVEIVRVAVELESALDACHVRCGFGELEYVFRMTF